MGLDMESTIPIYIQIAEEIENMILDGRIREGDQAPSMNQLSDFYKLNPATARKGLMILTDEGIIYKKRGLGMYVNEGAYQKVKDKRKDQFMEKYIKQLMEECQKLDLKVEDIIEMIKKYDGRG